MQRIILLVNDSYFSYLLARPFVERYRHDIDCVIFSTKTTGSFGKIVDIFGRTHLRYFFYRSLVAVSGKVIPYFRKRTVRALTRQLGINSWDSTDINSRKDSIHGDIGIAFNFDQIVKRDILNAFSKGVINIHASKLPKDKGVSPVLWAFARGDEIIWVTIYQMDEGLDSGPVFEQFSVPVFKQDSAFSLYARVCEYSGKKLVEVVEKLDRNEISPREQEEIADAEYWSWPDARHRDLMKRSGRKFIRMRELIRHRVTGAAQQ